MPTHITIKNSNPTNQLKITQEDVEVDVKTKKKTWKSIADTYVKPNTSGEVWVGGPRRIIIEEMPS